jgi:hypothetical protein
VIAAQRGRILSCREVGWDAFRAVYFLHVIMARALGR